MQMYLLALVDSGRCEATRLFKVKSSSVRAVEIKAHQVAATHRHAYPHDCRLDQYVVTIFCGPQGLPRIVATGGLHHGEWPGPTT